MKSTIEISEANFESEVLQSGNPVVVDFWAEWCGPCKVLAPVLEEVATDLAGKVKVVKVNIEENPALAERYSIHSIPTLLYFSDGRMQRRTLGLVSKKRILDSIDAMALAA